MNPPPVPPTLTQYPPPLLNQDRAPHEEISENDLLQFMDYGGWAAPS